MGFGRNLFYGILVGGLSLFSLKGKSQDVFGVDYIRKLEVNRATNYHENKKQYNFSIPSVEFKEPLGDEAKNSLEEKVMNVYFQTSKCDLSETDSIDLTNY